MLTEKCNRVINEILPRVEDDIQQFNYNNNAQHVPFIYFIKNICICNTVIPTGCLRNHKFTHLINIDKQFFLSDDHHIINLPNNYDDQQEDMVDVNNPEVEFEVLNLDFGSSYSLTVLPNLYKAVKFLEKAWENSGKILIGEENLNQKSVIILIAFIMYKYRMKYDESFHVIRESSNSNIILDKYFVAQLMEYEPILETQRRALLGSSCSSEIRSSRLKRKKNCSKSPSSKHQVFHDQEVSSYLDTNGNEINYSTINLQDSQSMET